MRFIAVIYIFLFSSCADGKEKKYTGSTPAGTVVRTFLGIPLSDSVDFIRWNLTLSGDQYSLHCNYGIGKPNTNSFYDGGKHLAFTGEISKEKIYVILYNKDKSLRLVLLNDDLLHMVNDHNEPLPGTAGWSYTLNNTNAAITDIINLSGTYTPIKDSVIFEGRTPCGVPGIIERGKECYKLKWLLVLHNNSTYKLRGTAWRVEEAKTGNWKLMTRDGRIIYQLMDGNNNSFILLLKPAENILLFIDRDGKLLVGNEDFSYTLNRRQI